MSPTFKSIGCLLLSLCLASFAEAQSPITGPRHQANIGKIVFAKTRITRDKMETMPLNDSFTDGDRIYGRAYLEKHFKDLKMDWGSSKGKPVWGYHFRLYVDGAKQLWLIENFSELSQAMLDSSTLQVLLNPEEDADQAKSWLEIVEKMAPGSHKIRIELVFGSGPTQDSDKAKTQAMGEFTYVRGAGKLSVGQKFSAIKASQSTPDLEKNALATINTYARNQGWKESFDKLKIVGTWTMLRHERTGVILGRRIDVAAAAKWPDGKCTSQIFSISQEHDGKDFMAQTAFAGVGQQTRIDCE